MDFNYSSTTIQKISEKLNNNSFYIKRDDLLPISFGGNKARKAILFFKNFEINEYDFILTYGSKSSNHCRIVANIAASKNIPCLIISPSNNHKETFNSKMVKIFGANIKYFDLTEINIKIKNEIDYLRKKGYKPFFIQGGGHGDLGTQAYVEAYKEIVDYEFDTGIDFDYIFHASGTGTTQAGLICGNLIKNKKKQIIGISIARSKSYGLKIIKDSICSYLNKINKINIKPAKVHFIDDYILEGYGSYNYKIIKIIKEVLINDGIPMDAIYTGKAYWGMKEYIKKNNIKNKNILFLHTGGVPLFFDNLNELIC
jgi:D-cysteine desulfhydrase